MSIMRITYDGNADAAYIYLIDRIGQGEVAKTSVAGHGSPALNSINLDFDADGRLLGIEVLGAGRALKEETLQGAERIDRRR